MGSTSSVPYRRLSSVIPQCHEPGWEESPKWPDRLRERDHLIQAITSVLSDNGQRDLDDYDFKLHFSNRNDGGEERFVATLVASKDGRIEAKIEPETDGETRTKAFKTFKKHVLATLDKLLETVPNVAAVKKRHVEVDTSMSEPVSPRISLETLMETNDLPPPYGAETHEARPRCA